ncbi:MAG: hypothetical protein AAF419_01900 [Pseudomonadota bacterium]
MLFTPTAFADQCPTVDMIKERKISREYEWWIEERRSLEEILSVQKLYSVRIKEKGKFVSCHYQADKLLIAMEAAPIKAHCTVTQYKGDWKNVNEIETVCTETDPFACLFAIYCDERTKQEITE